VSNFEDFFLMVVEKLAQKESCPDCFFPFLDSLQAVILFEAY
jgi:hypothetical protein